MSLPAPARRGVPDRDHVRELFHRLRDAPDDATRQELIEAHLGLVEYLARRFAGRGEPLEDLVQVGTIGLVKAVDRFDPDREVEFSTYATPTIVGEAHAAGVKVGTWTVDDPDVAGRLFTWGVDAVATNDPVSILSVRAELGARTGSL